MRDAIQNLNRQFAFSPKVENASKLKKRKKFLVCGMGGSNIPAVILKLCDPSLDLMVWNDYDLPKTKDIKERLVIAVSFSGNTEEVLSSFKAAKRLRLPLAVVTSGGILLEMARDAKVPHVQVPNGGIQPRMGTAYMLRGLMKIMANNKGLRESAKLEKNLDPNSLETAGKRLARKLESRVPIIYASAANEALAWNWKIKFNETAKIPAFASVLPEANHNEMNGFDPTSSTRALSKNFHFIFLEDPSDSERHKLRMKVTAEMYRKKGFKTNEVSLTNQKNIFLKMFSSIVLADWTAFHLALNYGVEAEKVPMVEDFKRKLKKA